MGKPNVLSCQAYHGTRAGDNDNNVLLRPELFAINALKGLTIQGEEVSMLADIWRGNWEGLYENVVAKAAATLKAGH